jgi:TPR repeat protein
MAPGRSTSDATSSEVGGRPGPWLFEAAVAADQGRRNEAIELYQAIAAQGDARGDTALGDLLSTPPDQDAERSADAFQRAAERGDPSGAVRLGRAYLDGAGRAVDRAEALRWFERGAELGSSEGARRAGAVLWSSDQGERNPERAEAMWRRATELGDEPEALLGLAEAAFDRGAHIDGVGWAIRAAYLTRRLLYEPSRDRRWSRRNSTIANAELAHQLEEAMDLVNVHRVELYDAALTDDAEACWYWGRITSLGFGDLPDPVEGRSWIQRAAEHGNADALHALAQSDRSDGNIEQFEAHLRAAAAQGHATSLHDLGYALYSGVFPSGTDVEGALDAYRAAAGPDHASTATDLSFVLEDVEGPDAADESLRWLRLAVAADDVAALRRLGERCRDGDGVDRDPSAAAHWFLKAYYLGWDEAIDVIVPFVDELDAADLAAADQAADGSGYAASVLIGSLHGDD